jgi:hypothetical protein
VFCNGDTPRRLREPCRLLDDRCVSKNLATHACVGTHVSSMSRSGNVRDNAAMQSFFSPLKTERTARKIHRTGNEARADVFDYIEQFYHATRRHSTIGYVSPVEFERKPRLA